MLRYRRPATAGEDLCLLHESMQNRRVLNNVAQSIGLDLSPTVTTNSFLAVCSYVCSGAWSSIMPHTFLYMVAEYKEPALIDLVEPVHGQTVGLVVTGRDPMPPLAYALLQCAMRVGFDAVFTPGSVSVV